MYNEHYRQGKESQYTWENVCIVPGGRAGLIRIAAILGNSYLSFPIPDYSAYSEMLTLFKNVGLLLPLRGTWFVDTAFRRSLLFLFPSRRTITIIFTPIRSRRKSPVVPLFSLPRTLGTRLDTSCRTASWRRFKISAEIARL